MGRRKNEQKDADVPIASMIDVVFLLIIFFVVTAAIDKEIEDELIILANAPNGKAVTEKDPRSVTINIRKDGQLNIGSVGMSISQITNSLSQAAKKFGNDIPIVLRGDKNVQHEYIKKVMEAVTATKLYKVRFNAEIK